MSYEDQIANLRANVELADKRINHNCNDLGELSRTVATLRDELQTHRGWVSERLARFERMVVDLQPCPEMPAFETTTELVGIGMGPANAAFLVENDPDELEVSVGNFIRNIESEGHVIDSVQFTMANGEYGACVVSRKPEPVQ